MFHWSWFKYLFCLLQEELNIIKIKADEFEGKYNEVQKLVEESKFKINELQHMIDRYEVAHMTQDFLF